MHPQASNMSQNSKFQSVIEPIFDETPTSSIVLARHSNDSLGSNNICCYFPQFEIIIYSQVKDNKMLLLAFVQSLVREHRQKFGDNIDTQSDHLTIKNSLKSQKIDPNKYEVGWWCHPIMYIEFDNNTLLNQVENKSTLVVRKSLAPSDFLIIKYDIHKNFRIKQLFDYYNLTKKYHTALKIGNNILRFFQTLKDIEKIVIDLNELQHLPIYPIFSFQIFYSFISQINEQLRNKQFDFDNFINGLENKKISKAIFNKYQLQKDNGIDKLTQLSIIYLTSPLYNPIQQMHAVKRLIDEPIQPLFEDQDIQKICVLTNRLQRFSCFHYARLIYIAELQQEELQPNMDEGKFVRFQSFLPAFSNKENLRLQELRYNVYQIQSVSAKYVGINSYEINGADYITLPCTEYSIESTRKERNRTVVHLVQMPFPKRFDSHIIIWIDDKMEEGRKYLDYTLQQQLNVQFILLKDNYNYQKWLKRYKSLTCFRNVRVITNMVRGTDYYAGIKTIEITRDYLIDDIEIMIYTGDTNRCRQSVAERIKNVDKIHITSNQKALNKFIRLHQNKQNAQICSECRQCQTENCQMI